MSGDVQAQVCFSGSLKEAERGLPRQSSPGGSTAPLLGSHMENPAHPSFLLPLEPGRGARNAKNPRGGFQQRFSGVETEIGLGLMRSWPPLGHWSDLCSLSAGGGLRVGTSCRDEVTSRTRCHQLSLELEGDSSHYLFAVGATVIYFLSFVFAPSAPHGCGRALVTCSVLGTCWGHGKPAAAFQGGGFWPQLGCWTLQVREVRDFWGCSPQELSGVSLWAVVIPVMSLHWGSHERNDEAAQIAGKFSESSS